MKQTLAVVLLFVLATVVFGQQIPLGRVHVDQKQRFVDETGHSILFHGINSVKKSWPFYSSFTDEQLDELAYEYGMNVVRLGITWEALEPSRGEYNSTYVEKTKELINRLGQRGIYTLIDMHQDLYGPKICGNGFPDWSVVVDPLVEALTPFPMPILGLTTFEYGPDGRISDEDCGKLPYWSFIYFTFVTGSAFQSLYEDTRMVQQAFVNAWTYLADELVGMKHVLGLELLNEPWPGRIYTEPGLLLRPGYADAKNLAPLYERLHDSIRQVDNETIIFYEPHVSTTQVLPFSAGFEQGPGGSEFRDRHAFAFHVYCPTVDATGTPQNEEYCDFYAETSFRVRDSDYKRLGGGVMMTEWGVFSDRDPAIDELRTLSTLCDDYLMSWAYWEYEGMKNLKMDRHLTNTYARSIAGNPISMHFDNETARFDLVYETNQIGLETEIFLRESLWYPNGFNVFISPSGMAGWRVGRKNFVYIVHNPQIPDGLQITVTITRL